MNSCSTFRRYVVIRFPLLMIPIRAGKQNHKIDRKMLAIVLCIMLACSCIIFTNAYKSMPHSIRFISARSAIEVGTVSSIPNGERQIVETSAGSVIVTNVDGNFYAVNAKCPHLWLPMKKVAYSNSLCLFLTIRLT